jgi:hypothetical protein
VGKLGLLTLWQQFREVGKLAPQHLDVMPANSLGRQSWARHRIAAKMMAIPAFSPRRIADISFPIFHPTARLNSTLAIYSVHHQ